MYREVIVDRLRIREGRWYRLDRFRIRRWRGRGVTMTTAKTQLQLITTEPLPPNCDSGTCPVRPSHYPRIVTVAPVLYDRATTPEL